ncbi:polysialyltransferase family glycosyltransferase [Psychroserpens burtonensis]|uniref:polysialyltransferase family glycosyltransferase n=1 Tax=Psychroserpens burtonensis TaxID=49278 RepID=UPI0012F79432|nr:hypothetical protein [Psychroserpens burtonensis]
MNNKSKSIKHIFIGIAPNHIINFENLISQDDQIQNTILLNPGHFEYDKRVWSSVINGSIEMKYGELSTLGKLKYQLHKLSGYRNFIQQIHTKLLHKNQKYNLYYCNLDDVLTNYVFHQLINEDLINENYVVEDGVLNYYYPYIDLKKLKMKRLLCKVMYNINFIPEKEHPTGISSSIVKGQYVRLPQKALHPEKSISLPYDEIYYVPDDDTILIIGQDIMHNAKEGLEYYLKRLELLFEQIQVIINENSKIVYKPHRNGDFKLATNLLDSMFNSYELFEDITPIEVCIKEIKPSQIFSFESSAMLNLKIAIKNHNVKIAVLPFNVKKDVLTNIFKTLEIDIL